MYYKPFSTTNPITNHIWPFAAVFEHYCTPSTASTLFLYPATHFRVLPPVFNNNCSLWLQTLISRNYQVSTTHSWPFTAFSNDSYPYLATTTRLDCDRPFLSVASHFQPQTQLRTIFDRFATLLRTLPILGSLLLVSSITIHLFPNSNACLLSHWLHYLYEWGRS